MVSLNCTTHWFVDAHAINCHLGIRSSGSVPVKIVSQVRCLQSFNGRLDGDGCAGKRRHHIPKSKNHWEGVASVPHSIPLGCKRDRAPNWSHQDICAEPVNDELIAQSICFCQAVSYGIIANFYDHSLVCIKVSRISNDSVGIWWVLIMRRVCLVTKSTRLRLRKVIELASIMCGGLMMPRWVIR